MKTQSPSYTPSSDGRAAAANANASGVPSPSVVPTPAPVPSTPSFGEAPVGDAQSSGKVTQPHPDMFPAETTSTPVETNQRGEVVNRILKVAPTQGLTVGEKEITVKTKDGKRVAVRLLHGLPVKHDGVLYYVVVTTEGDFKGYLVKADSVDTSDSKSILVSDVVELYDWSSELDYLFSDVNLIKRNALLSFWRAGAFFETDKENNHVRASMFDSAFPYKMP